MYRESEIIILSVIRLLLTRNVITGPEERSSLLLVMNYVLTYLTTYARKQMANSKLVPLDRGSSKNFEAQLLNENTHVEFCLKIVHTILLSQGNTEHLQKLVLS